MSVTQLINTTRGIRQHGTEISTTRPEAILASRNNCPRRFFNTTRLCKTLVRVFIVKFMCFIMKRRRGVAITFWLDVTGNLFGLSSLVITSQSCISRSLSTLDYRLERQLSLYLTSSAYMSLLDHELHAFYPKVNLSTSLCPTTQLK